MRLERRGREYYILTIVSQPPSVATDWKASFDDGVTWVTGVAQTGYDRNGALVTGVGWLLAGPLFAADAMPNPAGTVTLANIEVIRPALRLIAAPEVPIRSAPAIHLVG